MFNLSGSELIFLLLMALVVLGPDKLPEAVRKFGKTYGELKRMSTGFQQEFRSVIDEPMQELRGTADALRTAINDPFAGKSMSAGAPAVSAPAVFTPVTEPHAGTVEDATTQAASVDEPAAAASVDEPAAAASVDVAAVATASVDAAVAVGPVEPPAVAAIDQPAAGAPEQRAAGDGAGA